MEIKLTLNTGSVVISAQAGDDHRAARLFRIAHFLDLNDALPPELIRLHDHAGILRPCWRETPRNARVLQVIHEAWKNEGETQVWHMLGADPRGVSVLEYEVGAALKLYPYYHKRIAE